MDSSLLLTGRALGSRGRGTAQGSPVWKYARSAARAIRAVRPSSSTLSGRSDPQIGTIPRIPGVNYGGTAHAKRLMLCAMRTLPDRRFEAVVLDREGGTGPDRQGDAALSALVERAAAHGLELMIIGESGDREDEIELPGDPDSLGSAMA